MKETSVRLREFAEEWANTPMDVDVDIRRLNVSLFLDKLMSIINSGYTSNELVNQEVERRIAERMPSEEDVEINLASFDEITNDWFDFTHAVYHWIRSRLTNDSQKTEGGGE